MRRAVAVTAVLMMCVLGACGGKDPSSGSGSGSGSGGTKTSAPSKDVKTPFDACKKLTPDEVGAIIGGTATAEPVPGGGCTYKLDDLQAPRAGIFATLAAGGGYDASKAGNVTDGKVEDVSGIGDGAWVAVGKLGSSDNLQGQGVVSVGNQLINISITQSKGMDAAAIKDMEVKLLTLCAGKA